MGLLGLQPRDKVFQVLQSIIIPKLPLRIIDPTHIVLDKGMPQSCRHKQVHLRVPDRVTIGVKKVQLCCDGGKNLIVREFADTLSRERSWAK